MRELNVNEIEEVTGGSFYDEPQSKLTIILPGGETNEIVTSPIIFSW